MIFNYCEKVVALVITKLVVTNVATFLVTNVATKPAKCSCCYKMVENQIVKMYFLWKCCNKKCISDQPNSPQVKLKMLMLPMANVH